MNHRPPRLQRLTCIALYGLVLVAGLPKTAHADPSGRAVVIPVIVGDGGAEAAELFARARAARDVSGGEALSDRQTRRMTRSQVTVAPKKLLPAELDAWFRHQKRAQDQLMHYKYETAAKSLRAVQRVSNGAIEALNREAATARTVLDTCLYLVRSLWATGKHEAAEAQARQCRQLVPTIHPTDSLHTPDVRGVLHRVDEARRREVAAELTVDANEDGCLVRMNGLALGETPLVVRELIPGPYRVQVECTEGEPGRVYALELDSKHYLYADTGLERSLRLEPEPHLYYRSKGVMEARLAQDARALAKGFEAGGALVVTERKLIRYTPSDDEVAEALAGDVSDVRRLSSGLLGFKTKSRTADRPRGATKRAVGLSLSAAGGAVIATSVGLFGRRVRLGNRASSAANEAAERAALQDWEDARAGILVAAPIGASLTAAGFALAYKAKPKPPWWTWALGGAGVATLTAGVVSMVVADRCPSSVELTPECIPGQRAMDRGVVLLGVGAPFVFMPVWAVARRAEISVQANGAGLTVRGEF